MRKRVIHLVLILSLLLSLCGCVRRSSFEYDGSNIVYDKEPDEQKAPAPETEKEEPPAPPAEDEQVPTEPTEYTNGHDGYCITVPAGYTVSCELGGRVTVLESDDTAIEIYKQDLNDLTEEEYLNYVNRFLKNSVDHHLDLDKTFKLNRRQYHVTAWHRDAMKVIPSDRNYYMSFDFTAAEALWCVLVKTTDHTQNPAKYKDIIGSMEFIRPNAKRPVWKSNVVKKERNAETEEYYNRVFGEDAKLSWGIFEKQSANGDMSALNATEEKVAHEFSVLVTYVGLTKTPDTEIRRILDTAWADGKVTELTLQTLPNADGSNMMYDILEGEYDDAISHYAETIRDFSHPVLLRPFNEMNGDWCEYSAFNTSKDTGIYKAVYRYVYSIFERKEVTNVLWVWNPNEGSFPDFSWNHALTYYPGDEYVDIVGLTAYNTGDYYKKEGERWKSFTTLYKDLYREYCDLFAQPLMITEFACAERGGDKRAWVRDMFEKLPYYGRIKVAVWWSHVDYDPKSGKVARDYRIGTVSDIFKENLANK